MNKRIFDLWFTLLERGKYDKTLVIDNKGLVDDNLSTRHIRGLCELLRVCFSHFYRLKYQRLTNAESTRHGALGQVTFFISQHTNTRAFYGRRLRRVARLPSASKTDLFGAGGGTAPRRFWRFPTRFAAVAGPGRGMRFRGGWRTNRTFNCLPSRSLESRPSTYKTAGFNRIGSCSLDSERLFIKTIL